MASILPYFVFFFIISAVHGLRCYKCNSQDNASCKWGFTSFTFDTEECVSVGLLDSVFTPKCYKLTAENKEGTEYIARGCLPPPGSFSCSAMAKAVGWFSSFSDDPQSLSNLQCETCDTDKCNSATKLAGFAFIGLLLSSIAFLL